MTTKIKVVEFDKQNIELSTETLAVRSKESKDSLYLKLNNKLLTFTKTKHTIPINNFTSALHLSMCAIDLKRGDKIICSINSSPTVPEVIRHYDAEPIFVDVAKDSFQIDLTKLKLLIDSTRSKKLKGIFISHMDGELFPISQINKIIGGRQITIIEDASLTLGLDRQEIDHIADIKLFSLDNALSRFAFFTTNNDEMFQRAKLLSNNGLVYEESASVDYIYDVLDLGCNYQPSKLDTMFALSTLEVLTNHLAVRRLIAKKYTLAFSNLPNVSILELKDNHSYARFIIRIYQNRDTFALELKERGIQTRLHYIPVHLLTYYKNKYDFKINSFPNALQNYYQILSLPIHSALTNDDVEHIIESVKAVAKHRYQSTVGKH